MASPGGGGTGRDPLDRSLGRRDFVELCGTLAPILALPRSVAAQMAEALDAAPKPSLVWLEFQDCAGNTESFLRAGRPTAADIVLDLLFIPRLGALGCAISSVSSEVVFSTFSELAVRERVRGRPLSRRARRPRRGGRGRSGDRTPAT